MSCAILIPEHLRHLGAMRVGKRNNRHFMRDEGLSGPWTNETEQDEFVGKDCKNE